MHVFPYYALSSPQIKNGPFCFECKEGEKGKLKKKKMHSACQREKES